ncbi:hypothetical protein LOY44_23870 [Pseudomonas sp. B21-044]|uniref:hypothetical protein n=1 Tax=Pseudomonas sp. B21-044 TaxID=2895488 RepID=UPI00216054EE|nr:hypothetical protein [Pseudomonas sp. B21-044]UVL18980.1 hypothetical protein LOY44_23870 [Pseudomonas sp. B21-044]
MASNILPRQLFPQNLTHDLLTEVAPELDALDGEMLLEKFTGMLQPALDAVVSAYKHASANKVTEHAFRLFLQNLVAADEG